LYIIYNTTRCRRVKFYTLPGIIYII